MQQYYNAMYFENNSGPYFIILNIQHLIFENFITQ